jgi:methionyl-tRNA formyltransferase
MKNVVFLGSKSIGYQCLEYLIDLHNEEKISIQGVICRDHAQLGNGLSFSDLLGQHQIHQYSSLDEIEDCDLLYSVQHHEILKKQHLDKAKLTLNLHMAPLPEYRGANQFTIALLEDKKEFGVTIHKMDTQIDHGDIAFEKRWPIKDNMWVQDLYLEAEQYAFELFHTTFQDILNNHITWTPQSTLEKERGTSLHFKKEINDLKILDHKWPQEKILKYVRATYMPGFEPPYFIIDDKKVYLSPEHA